VIISVLIMVVTDKLGINVAVSIIMTILGYYFGYAYAVTKLGRRKEEK
jgi:flagellar motor component MotA